MNRFSPCSSMTPRNPRSSFTQPVSIHPRTVIHIHIYIHPIYSHAHSSFSSTVLTFHCSPQAVPHGGAAPSKSQTGSVLGDDDDNNAGERGPTFPGNKCIANRIGIRGDHPSPGMDHGVQFSREPTLTSPTLSLRTTLPLLLTTKRTTVCTVLLELHFRYSIDGHSQPNQTLRRLRCRDWPSRSCSPDWRSQSTRFEIQLPDTHSVGAELVLGSKRIQFGIELQQTKRACGARGLCAQPFFFLGASLGAER